MAHLLWSLESSGILQMNPEPAWIFALLSRSDKTAGGAGDCRNPGTPNGGVVHVLISSETTEHRLPQQTNQSMAAILAGAHVGECLACHRAQPERVV
jgi:hypothetical protein